MTVRVPDEFDPVREGLGFPLYVIQPELLEGRGADDDGNRLGIRQHLKNTAKETREIVVDRDDGLFVGQTHAVDQSLLDRRQHHRCFREKLRRYF